MVRVSGPPRESSVVLVDCGNVGKVAQGSLEMIHGHMVQNQGAGAVDVYASADGTCMLVKTVGRGAGGKVLDADLGNFR